MCIFLFKAHYYLLDCLECDKQLTKTAADLVYTILHDAPRCYLRIQTRTRVNRGTANASMPRKEVVQHDLANLVILPVVGALCTAAYFEQLPYTVPMAVMLVYIIIDFAWIAAVPTCVPKAPLILTHHVFTAVLLLIALYDIQRFGYYGVLDGMVEVNTFFLVARRTFPVKAVQPVFGVLYWATYPLFRLFMYVVVGWATLFAHMLNSKSVVHQPYANRYPYVLYLLLDELAGEVVLALLIYPCQLFLIGFNCLLLYMTWPRGARVPSVAASVGRRTGLLHPDGRVRVGMAPRVLH